MAGKLASTRRLFHAGRTLAKYDALIPAEFADDVPRLARWAARLLSLGGARQAKGVSIKDLPMEERLCSALESLGPAFIKFGQLLATRADIVGPELAGALTRLQDKLPPFAVEIAKQIVATDLERPVDELFVTFEPALAAASIAQVHAATIIETVEGGAPQERHVAVKVLRPDVGRIFARDLDAFRLGAALAEKFVPASRRLEPVKLIETLAASVRVELDLRLEGAAAAELKENLAGRADFQVPATHWQRTSKRVLTTDWVDGIALNDSQGIARSGVDQPKLAALIVQSFLRQALDDGFFHADMHPGNLFLLPDAKDTDGGPVLAAVDFGIMGRLDRETQRYLATILFGFSTGDYGAIAKAHFEAGYVPTTHSKEDFAQALRAIGAPLMDQPAEAISMAKLLTQLFDTTAMFDMHLRPELVLLQKTMVVVEGVARGFDPQLNMFTIAEPVVEAWMMRTMGPEARLSEAAGAAVQMARILTHMPDMIERVETAANLITDMTEEGGLKLHPQTAQEIADIQIRRTRSSRVAIWIAAAALALLAVGSL